jgi:hypothetical protein
LRLSLLLFAVPFYATFGDGAPEERRDSYEKEIFIIKHSNAMRDKPTHTHKRRDGRKKKKLESRGGRCAFIELSSA